MILRRRHPSDPPVGKHAIGPRDVRMGPGPVGRAPRHIGDLRMETMAELSVSPGFNKVAGNRAWRARKRERES